MPLLPVDRIARNRLAAELNAMGLDPTGSRSELLTRLKSAGVYNIHADVPPIKKTMQLYNHSNILLGGAAHLNHDKSNKFIIHNTEKCEPLLTGDFGENSLSLPQIIHIKNSDVNNDTPGNEGDIRRSGSELYMYRSTGVHPGWYPLMFGSVTIF